MCEKVRFNHWKDRQKHIMILNKYTAHVHLVETGRERNPDDLSILWVCQTNKLGPRLLVYNRCLLFAKTGLVLEVPETGFNTAGSPPISHHSDCSRSNWWTVPCTRKKHAPDCVNHIKCCRKPHFQPAGFLSSFPKESVKLVDAEDRVIAMAKGKHID